MRRHILRRPAVFFAAFITSLFACLLLAAVAVNETGPSAALGGSERYLTHVATDKPIYRPGERLYVRAAVLRADSRAPFAGAAHEQSLVEIRGPKGDTVASGYARHEHGVVGFAWDVPAALAGGQYTIKVSNPQRGFAPGERKFDVRAYRAPRLKSQTIFLRDGYGPGDEARATLHTERAEGGIPAGAKVTVVARVDGAEVHRAEAKVDASGNCSANFKLPTTIARGEGTLAWTIEDGGVLETATKTIPIRLQTVDLTMYPEGGDLVAGLPARVYLEAFTPAKKPADLAGEVVDEKGERVATFRTEHEGRGRFEFTPAKAGRYTLRITEPAGIKTTYALPAVKADGAAIRAVNDVSRKGEPVVLRVSSSKHGKVKVTLARREVQVAATDVTFANPILCSATGPAPGTWHEVQLTPPDSADGVLIATVWDESGKPLAERLVFRDPAKSVNVRIEPDQSSYIPGGRVALNVITTGDDGKPVGAVVGVAVTDDSVLEMIEKREQAPRLPVMVLLESDVRELADAHVYLDKADPKAPVALDLLLGTQGWRRFAFVETTKFVEGHGDAARRVLALQVASRRELEEADRFAWADLAAAGAVPQDAAAPVANRPMRAAAPPAAVGGPVPAELPAAEAEAQAPIQAEQKVVGDLRQALGKAEALEDEADLLGGERRKQRAREIRNDFVAVREYAHAARPDRRPDDRVDFAETLYWHAGVKTDDATGRARLSFDTSDAVTSFRCFADAFTPGGALGSSTATVESVQPFYVEPKLPLQVTSGDVIRLPIAIVNGTSNDLPAATVTATPVPGVTFSKIESFILKANSRDRRTMTIDIGDFAGNAELRLGATAGGKFADNVTRPLDVRPLGFPVDLTFGGTLGPDAAVARHEIVIPAGVVPNSVASSLAVYPTPLANLTQALEALLQSPNGCFEQTSSTTYPLVMAQQYFLSHAGVDPSLVERSGKLLDEGYNRLIGFECQTTKGFEWFGADPGHEALSAYGLLEFTDMAQVRNVDPRLLADTRAFVMKCRDGAGGFKRERNTLHTWIADPECSNGYITWALLECGQTGLEREVAWLKDASLKTSNSYAVALAANVMSIAGDREAARSLMSRLAAKQNKDGGIDGATTSIVGSGGEALQIETTALATLAWLRDPSYAGNVEHAMRWLADTCKAGRFGSTQSTVLALRAIVAYDKSRARPKAPGTVQVFVDGKPMGSAQAFDANTQGAIKLQDVREMLSPGKHTVELRMTDGSTMPYSVAVRYHATTPASSEQCKVKVEVSLKDRELAEGGVTEANVTVTNRDASAPIPTPVAIVGIPGGLEVRHDQLKELVKSNKIAAYEVTGREVVLYWRSLAPGQKVEVPLSLVAAIPGTYTGPASRAYLYYTDEFKDWADGVKVDIR